MVKFNVLYIHIMQVCQNIAAKYFSFFYTNYFFSQIEKKTVLKKIAERQDGSQKSHQLENTCNSCT